MNVKLIAMACVQYDVRAMPASGSEQRAKWQALES